MHPLSFGGWKISKCSSKNSLPWKRESLSFEKSPYKAYIVSNGGGASGGLSRDNQNMKSNKSITPIVMKKNDSSNYSDQ